MKWCEALKHIDGKLHLITQISKLKNMPSIALEEEEKNMENKNTHYFSDELLFLFKQSNFTVGAIS